MGVRVLENPRTTFDYVLRGVPVKGFAGTVQGKDVVFFVYKSGPYQGQIANAVAPSARQAAQWGIRR